MTAVWVVKAGRMGEREQRVVEHGVVAMGWEELGDLSGVHERESLKRLYQETYEWASEGNVNMNVGQIWAFLRKMEVGQLVITPIKTRSEIAVGTIRSSYRFTGEYGPDMQHVRDVNWLRTDLPRSSFDPDLRASFTANPTVYRVSRSSAEARIRAVVEGGATVREREDADIEDVAQELDLEQIAYDQIAEYIERRFREHELAPLVEALLKAEGYVTQVSEPGPDGGVDILAGSGPLGLDSPKLCVQVKSGRDAEGHPTLRDLVGTMQAFGAEQGLLVSLGGFTRKAESEARRSYFSVRLWDKTRFLKALLGRYDQLSPEIKTELPLERMWRLATPREEES